MTASNSRNGESYWRAIGWVSLGSVLSPLVGVIIAPILSQTFAPDDRGELAAAVAPATLILSVATFGLPDALTYHLARGTRSLWGPLAFALAATTVLGMTAAAATLLASPLLASGMPDLKVLITLGAIIVLPALWANVLRGTAIGLHWWRLVAGERLAVAVLRLLAFGGLSLSGSLNLVSAVFATFMPGILAGTVYLPAIFRHRSQVSTLTESAPSRALLTYGLRIWLGSVASVLLARVDQLFLAPLTGTAELGLYSVAVTISELPLVVALAIQSALFGVASKDRDFEAVARAGRLTAVVLVAVCLLVGITLPLWIKAIFGANYGPAAALTELLLLGVLISLPALTAGTILTSHGTPGKRTLALYVTLATNLACLLALTPILGALGACITSVVSSAVFSLVSIAIVKRQTGIGLRELALIRYTDLLMVRAAFVQRWRPSSDTINSRSRAEGLDR